MATIILDIGSGNTCRNNIEYAKKMVDEVIKIDNKKHRIVFKAQLFQDRPPNIPLDHGVFNKLYNHCKHKGYHLTASVFDLFSLDFLVAYSPIFIKIANDKSLNWLVGEIPRKYKVYRSVGTSKDYLNEEEHPLFCVSKYPASIDDYPHGLGYVSDHTVGLELFKRDNPKVWEKHLVLEYDTNNPDGGLFACTPQQLKEIL